MIRHRTAPRQGLSLVPPCLKADSAAASLCFLRASDILELTALALAWYFFVMMHCNARPRTIGGGPLNRVVADSSALSLGELPDNSLESLACDVQ